MVYKSAFAVVLLLCITATVEARRIKLGSGSLRSHGWFGTKRDFSYTVPYNVYCVSLKPRDRSTAGLTLLRGNGKATLSWTKGSPRAYVHAWVNGKVWGTNHITWTVWGWTK